MQQRHNSAGLPVLILGAGILLACSQPAFAVRLVDFTVSIGGKVVLRTSTGDEGEDADTVWRYLKRLELRPVKGFNVEADGDDPLRATLKGTVVIESHEGGRAEVSELKLVREKADAPWKVAPAEVERTFKSRHKPIEFRVSMDGKVVLWTRDAYTAEDADNAWRDLKRLELRPFQFYKVKADGDDPLRATLKGKVIIQANYGGRNGGRAEVSELKLVREKDGASWKVAPAEVERTFKSSTKPR